MCCYQVPDNIGKPHSTAITEVLKVMVQWLGEHDLAHFFREDVNLLQFPKYKRVSWREIRGETRKPTVKNNAFSYSL